MQFVLVAWVRNIQTERQNFTVSHGYLQTFCCSCQSLIYSRYIARPSNDTVFLQHSFKASLPEIVFVSLGFYLFFCCNLLSFYFFNQFIYLFNLLHDISPPVMVWPESGTIGGWPYWTRCGLVGESMPLWAWVLRFSSLEAILLLLSLDDDIEVLAPPAPYI